MDQIESLKRQTLDSHQWTEKLLLSIPEKYWNETPGILDTNVSWQVGHLIVSQHFHAIMVICGIQAAIIEEVPLREYTSLYAFDGTPKDSAGKVAPHQLKKHLKFIQERSVEIIDRLQPAHLACDLEPTKVPHPIAKTKFEALSWNIKHTMWHCGQLALLKRIFGERLNFTPTE